MFGTRPSAQSSILAGLLVHEQLGGELLIVGAIEAPTTQGVPNVPLLYYDELFFVRCVNIIKEEGLNARHFLSHICWDSF